MRRMNKLMFGLMLLAASAWVSSCVPEDDTIDVGDGLALADGYYFTVNDEDPDETTQLILEKVELAGSNDPVDRDGYYGNYVFLDAGSYRLAEVKDRELVESYGAELALKEELENDDPSTGYLIGTPDVDASSFALEAGFYKIGYDEQTNELLIMEVESVSLIGSATEGGWGSDTQLDFVSSSVDEGMLFESSGIILRNGAFKIRINNGWKMARFADGGGFAPFTNYGGSVDMLEPGGSDIQHAEEGEYTISVLLTNEGGAEMTMERTGDAPEITFDPDEYQFGIIGNGTAQGWDADMNMFYKGVIDGAHTWLTVVTLTTDGGVDPNTNEPLDGYFKFRTNDSWDFNLGGSIEVGSQTELTNGGSDILVPADGAYYVTLSTADEGTSWQITIIESGWGVIGEGSPVGNWDSDIQMDAALVDGTEQYTITGNFTAGSEWKFRAGGAWDYNLGGDLSALSADGSNLSVDADGEYTVTLIYDGTTYSATIE